MADREPITLRVQGFPQEMVGNPATIEEGWLPFFVSADYPLRMIAATTRFDLRRPLDLARDQLRIVDIQRRTVERLRGIVSQGNGHVPADALAAYLDTLGDAAQGWIDAALADGDVHARATWEQALTVLDRAGWRRRWLLAYERYFERMNTHLALRGLRHTLIAWHDEGMRPGDFAQQVGRAFTTSATVDMLPNLLPVSYVERYAWREGGCYLEPEEPDHPLCAMLTLASPLRGQWDTTVLHRLLNVGCDVAVCIDVQPVSRTTMEYQADQTITNRTWQFRRGTGPRDARAEREYAAAHRAQEDLSTEAAHDLRLVVAVFGDDLDTLNQNVRLITSAAGTRVPLMRIPGQQAELARYFTTDPTKRIEARTRVHRMLSHGVAVTTMFGLRKPDRTDGILWLFQGDTPIFFNPIKDKRAGHAVVLGKTGSGKTFALNAWMMRWLAQGHQVVLYEPQGHSERFIRACGAGGARFVLNLDQQLNILDVVATRGERNEPPSLGVQVAHVATQLSVLLGGSTMTASGAEQFYPRVWESIERGILEIALQQLYAPWPDLDALSVERTPILADLCAALREVGRQLREREREELAGVNGDIGGDRRRKHRSDSAFDLAGEIELRLIMGPYGKNFNARTSVDWDFSHDATAYDFSQIPEGAVRIFYYAQAFGALNRAVRAPSRDRARPLWAVIDEFKYMASVPSLATFAASAVKTWRTFGAALWTADQDAHTYLGTEGSVPDPAMLSVWLNSTMKMILRQDQADAARIAEKIQGMQPAHADLITRLTRGDIVLVWESDDDLMTYNEVFVGRVGVDDQELRAFRGS
ncbi:hypothetical protein EKD04_017930 [Chloroflexales bacterium ZM16-3]|nr:hypothetical protein [Chloroflexales bacterium ZM16-3]